MITLLPPLAFLQLALFITGLAWGICNNLVNYLTLHVTRGSSKEINRIHAAFSVGAFLAPLLVALASRAGLSWRWPVLLVAALALALFAYLGSIKFPEIEKKSKQTNLKGKGNIFTEWRLYLFMLILFCYVGVETGFSGWLVTYLTSLRGIEASLAQGLLSTLWVSMIAGRLLMSVLGSSLRQARVVVAEALLILLAAVLLAWSSSALLLTFAVI